MENENISFSQHSLSCFRTWRIFVKNITLENKNYFECLTTILHLNVPVKIRKRNQYLAANFIYETDDREKEFQNLAMYMQPIGVVITAYINSNEDFSVRLGEIKTEYAKLIENSSYLNSILIIFSDFESTQEEFPNDIFHFSHAFVNSSLTKTGEDLIIQHITAYLTNIFIILQSKCAEYSGYKPSKIIYKCGIESSFENDLEVKLVKKIMGARYNKLIGDINLLLGNFSKAIYFYNVSIEILSNFDDNLWIAACLEGIACACYHITISEFHKNVIFKIFINTKQSSSEGIDLDSRYRDTLSRGTEKYLLDSLEYFRRYFGDVPMFVEYHLISILLNFYINNKTKSQDIVDLCSSKNINRILSIDNLIDKLDLLQLHMEAFTKILYLRKCSVIIFYFCELVLKFKSVQFYTKAEESMLNILSITKFDENNFNFSRRWGKIHLSVLNNLIILYNLQRKNKESLRIQLFLMSNLKTYDIFNKIFDDNSFISNDNCILALQVLPIYNSVKFSAQGSEKIFKNTYSQQSTQSDLFIFKAHRQKSIDEAYVFSINQTLSIIFEFYNPLPIVLSATIDILTNIPDIATNYRDNVVIQPRSIISKQFDLLIRKETDFEITAYESYFFGIKCLQKLSSLRFQAVSADSMIETELISLTNSFEIKFKTLCSETDLSFDTYDGSIIDCKLKIKAIKEFKPHLIFIKPLSNQINISSKEIIYGEDCIFRFQIGDILDPWLIQTGNHQFKIQLNAFTVENEWTISHTITINLKVNSHLVVEYFSLLPKNNFAEVSLCRLNFFNLTSQDTNLFFHSGDVKITYLIKSYSRQNIDIDFPKSDIDVLLDLMTSRYFEDFFQRYLLKKLNVKWEKSIDDVILTGSLICKFIVQKEYFINFILFPYINIDFCFEKEGSIQQNPYQCSINIVVDIKITAKNNLNYDLSKLNISLFSSKMFDAEKSILWLGSISKKINQIKMGESISLKFQLLFLKPGSYSLDLIVQTDENEHIWEKLDQFFKITDSQHPNTLIESYFSKKSINSNTYVSCLALENIYIDAKSNICL